MCSAALELVTVISVAVAHIKLSVLHKRTQPSIERRLHISKNIEQKRMRKEDMQVTE